MPYEPAAERLSLPKPPLVWPALSFALALLVQAATGVWWAAQQDARTERLEHSVAGIDSDLLARLDERTGYTQEAVKRIELRLDQLTDRAP